MPDKAITKYQPTTLEEIKELGNIFAASGMFPDARSEPRAIALMLAGQEFGLGPFASLRSFHFIESKKGGRVTLAGNLVATLIKTAPGYDYRILEHTSEKCTIEFVRNGEALGRNTYTVEEARRAGLVRDGSSWVKWPKSMVFYRCLTTGARFHMPEVSGGVPLYTPDEFGKEVNELGEVIEGTFAESQPPPQSDDKESDGLHYQPYDIADPETQPKAEASEPVAGEGAGIAKWNRRTPVIQYMKGSRGWHPKKIIATMNKAEAEGLINPAMSNDQVIAALERREDDKGAEAQAEEPSVLDAAFPRDEGGEPIPTSEAPDKTEEF